MRPKLKHGKHGRVTEVEIYPIIYQPVIDVEKNGLCAYYYGRRDYTDIQKYRQEISLVFHNENFTRSRLINHLYEWLRRLIYGRRVDIETFYAHVEHSQVTGLSFPGIYSSTATWHETAHADHKQPTPIRPVQDFYTEAKTMPYIYVNTWNHSLAPHDNNSDLRKRGYCPYHIIEPFHTIEINYATRQHLERKYRNK